MLFSKSFAAADSLVTDTLELPYEARLKSRQHLQLADGQPFGYNLPPGTCLQHGDKLLAIDGDIRRVVAVVAASESLVEVRGDDALHMARAAYHLGNRHVRVEIGVDSQGNYLRLQPDHVLEDMLLHQGCTVQPVQASFQPEGGAYGGHSHSHQHSHGEVEHQHGAMPGPKIHTFR